ncbi:MAG TPA: monovalent cation:proton antiporter-2 (CPA2) family protein [Nitrospiria bacterium]|nr:monovalent cation:proton antiporter-2 (CPA2) family protein [Nitrospiria bacterium]
MPPIEFLQDLVVIFGFSIVVVLIFQRIQLPSIIGFLIAGVVVGPYGLNLIDDVGQVRVLAEIGVVMLLFTIGLEFSLARLSQVRAFALSGGALQVGLTIVLTASVFLGLQQSIKAGIFWGCLLALSSTAIVLKILMDRNELDAPHGRLSVGILIFQDLIVVPMMLVTPFLGNGNGRSESTGAILLTLVEMVLLLGVLLLAARWVAPKLLMWVVRTRNREIFVIAVILICLGIAWLTSRIGLSLAIGAFIAGLVISESEYGHQALAEVTPFRDSFNGLFFVSIGMLLDLRILVNDPVLILGAAAAVMILKGLVAGGVTLVMGYPIRVAALVGLALFQVGEFSFVLAQFGQDQGVLGEKPYQLFLAISILSMVATPFAIRLGPPLSDRAESFRPLRRLFGTRQMNNLQPKDLAMKEHVIIAGYGFNGQNLAKALTEAGIHYVAVDIHGDLVRLGRAQNIPIYFGDVTRPEVLRHLRIDTAKTLVLALSDPFALRRALHVARQANPSLLIIARSRYVRDLDELYRLGANDVVPEELESSVEIAGLVLNRHGVPRGQITLKQDEIRREGYSSLTRAAIQPMITKEILPPEVEVFRHRLLPDSPAVGQSLAQLGLPVRTGAIIVAVIREGETRSNPGGSFILEAEDVLVLAGVQEVIKQAIIYLDEGDRGRTMPPEPDGGNPAPSA